MLLSFVLIASEPHPVPETSLRHCLDPGARFVVAHGRLGERLAALDGADVADVADGALSNLRRLSAAIEGNFVQG